MHVLALEKIAMCLRRGSKRARAHTQGSGPASAPVLPRFRGRPSTLPHQSFHVSAADLPRFRACPSTLPRLSFHASASVTPRCVIDYLAIPRDGCVDVAPRGHRRPRPVARGDAVPSAWPQTRTRNQCFVPSSDKTHARDAPGCFGGGVYGGRSDEPARALGKHCVPASRYRPRQRYKAGSAGARAGARTMLPRAGRRVRLVGRHVRGHRALRERSASSHAAPGLSHKRVPCARPYVDVLNAYTCARQASTPSHSCSVSTSCW